MARIDSSPASKNHLAIRGLMIARGWDYNDLAAEAGMTYKACWGTCVGHFTGKGRVKIELAFGSPIWSSTDDFELRLRCREVLGFVPDLLTKPQLLARAKEHDLHPSRKESRSRPELVALLNAHFRQILSSKPENQYAA